MGEAKRIVQIVKDFKGNVEWITEVTDNEIDFNPAILSQYEKEGKIINGEAKEYIERYEPDLYKLIIEDYIKLGRQIFANKEADFIRGDECWYKGKNIKGQQFWNARPLSEYLKEKGN